MSKLVDIEIRSTEDDRISIANDDWHRWNEIQRQIGEDRVVRHTLRDEFAMAALPCVYNSDSGTFANDAKAAYELADAMLAARDGSVLTRGGSGHSEAPTAHLNAKREKIRQRSSKWPMSNNAFRLDCRLSDRRCHPPLEPPSCSVFAS